MKVAIIEFSEKEDYLITKIWETGHSILYKDHFILAIADYLHLSNHQLPYVRIYPMARLKVEGGYDFKPETFGGLFREFDWNHNLEVIFSAYRIKFMPMRIANCGPDANLPKYRKGDIVWLRRNPDDESYFKPSAILGEPKHLVSGEFVYEHSIAEDNILNLKEEDIEGFQ